MKYLKKYSLLIIIAFLFTNCEEILYEEDISEETVVLTAPVDAAELNQTNITLSWELLEGADQYHVQIATPSFEAALQIVQDSIMAANNFLIELTPNDYEWRVKAQNSEYQTQFTIQSFTVN